MGVGQVWGGVGGENAVTFKGFSGQPKELAGWTGRKTWGVEVLDGIRGWSRLDLRG